MTELETVIKLHEKLIYKIASRFHDAPKEDLFQAGVMGIIKAYNKFNDNGTTKFTTYAYNWIFGEMFDLACSLRAIKINKDILKTYKKIEQARYLLCQKVGYIPSDKEIATYLEMEEETFSKIMLCTKEILSLDVEEERPIYETIPAVQVESNIIDIKDSMRTLEPVEHKVIDYRYFKEYTQSETAKIMGISQVTVSRYEKKSLNKMHNYLAS